MHIEFFSRKNDFSNLAKALTLSTKNQTQKLKGMLNYGIQNELVAKEKYIVSIIYHLQQQIKVEDVGFCVQPSLPWLEASPDGLIVYKGSTMEPGLLEIKCPYAKRNWSPNELLYCQKQCR